MDDHLLHEWLHAKQFHTVCAYAFRRNRHINMQEACALRIVICHAAADPHLVGSRVPFVVDSSVVACSLVRGRSSSQQLNTML